MNINARHESSQASKNIWAVQTGFDGCVGGETINLSGWERGVDLGGVRGGANMIKHIVLNSQRTSYSKACCVPSH